MSETYKVYASQDYVQEQLKSVQIEVDTTLTASGKAADAKTVGEAIANLLTREQMEAYVEEMILGGEW